MSNETIYCMVHNPEGRSFAPSCPVCRQIVECPAPAPAAPQADTKKAASVVAAAERLGLLPQAEASAEQHEAVFALRKYLNRFSLAKTAEAAFRVEDEAIEWFARALAAERMAERERCEAEHKQADRRTEALIIAAADLYATNLPFGQLPDDVEHALDRLCAIVENQADVIEGTISAAIRGGKA